MADSYWFRNVTLVDGQVLPGEVLVEALQLKPDTVEEFVGWTGLYADRLVSGGLLMSVGYTIVGRVELGDWAIKRDGTVTLESADGFSQRWM